MKMKSYACTVLLGISVLLTAYALLIACKQENASEISVSGNAYKGYSSAGDYGRFGKTPRLHS
jgi:major membrane immunogen (membrane-anchored lipoprotein)